MRGIVIITIVVFVVWILSTVASTRVKKRRARRDWEMINRYLLEREKCD